MFQGFAAMQEHLSGQVQKCIITYSEKLGRLMSELRFDQTRRKSMQEGWKKAASRPSIPTSLHRA